LIFDVKAIVFKRVTPLSGGANRRNNCFAIALTFNKAMENQKAAA
jgi:hypothetical protein